MARHPIQPLEKDDSGVLRFKENAIVSYLLRAGGIDLNQIACLPFSREDREQFAQLIGYSHSGSADLDYMSDDTWRTAALMSDHPTEEAARVEVLEKTLAAVRSGLKDIIPELFRIHPDDLHI